MDRDRRLTGFLRGQTDMVKAPEGFELSNPWRVRLLLLGIVRGCGMSADKRVVGARGDVVGCYRTMIQICC